MMRAPWGLLAVVLAASPAISYFKYQRPVTAALESGQHYAVLDEAIWQHALPNLDDLRLYSTGKEIPYARKTMWDSRKTEQKKVQLFQPATLGGNTTFLLDMLGVPEYDRITLALRTKNYVAHARVEGQDDPHGSHWANLGTTTLFDLSDEKLGHNSSLQIPASTYKYLRVTMDGLVKPSDIQGGTAGIERAQEAVWRDLSSELKQSQEGKDTVLMFAIPENIPVERVMFDVDSAQGNFQREIELQSDEGSVTRVGEISRIHVQRNGKRIDVDHMSFSLAVMNNGQLRAVIHNGDDAPLRIARVRLQQYERRIYFDCDAGASLQLYYGDEKLEAPVYEYAKLFENDVNAGLIQIGAEEANAAYAGRPDERPWSERHPVVLWAAILAAVGVLGGIAVRSIRSTAA